MDRIGLSFTPFASPQRLCLASVWLWRVCENVCWMKDELIKDLHEIQDLYLNLLPRTFWYQIDCDVTGWQDKEGWHLVTVYRIVSHRRCQQQLDDSIQMVENGILIKCSCRRWFHSREWEINTLSVNSN